MDRIIDKYLAFPIITDILISVGIWMSSKNLFLFNFELIDRANQISIIPSIISTDVSLAGFILAALTIIVTFKSNLQSKGIDQANNALELIFSSKHYGKIVQVFKNSLFEFVLCFIFLFVAWLSSDNLSIATINRVNVTGIFITTLAIMRSLFILFLVLGLDKHKRSDQ